MTYRARIEADINGKQISTPVLPRGHRRTFSTTFKTREAAIKAVSDFKGCGRGLVYPSTMTYPDELDWSQVSTIAL